MGGREVEMWRLRRRKNEGKGVERGRREGREGKMEGGRRKGEREQGGREKREGR